MKTVLDRFLTRSDDGQEIELCEVLVESEIATQRDHGPRTCRNQYFREADGGMRARLAEQVGDGVFELDDGLVVRRVKC